VCADPSSSVMHETPVSIIKPVYNTCCPKQLDAHNTCYTVSYIQPRFVKDKGNPICLTSFTSKALVDRIAFGNAF
jgi:hypothetical protein